MRDARDRDLKSQIQISWNLSQNILMIIIFS